MKNYIKHSILITLTLLMLTGIAMAETPVKIGLTTQPNPFEANPSAATTFGNYISAAKATAVTSVPTGAFSVSGATSSWDKDLTTFATLTLRTASKANNDAGRFDVKTFEQDTSAPAITQVDLRIRYSYVASSPAANFQYNITADLGSGASSTLVANTGTSAALATYKWDNLAKPSGSLPWTWANINALRIKFGEKHLTITGDVTYPTFRVYEVWLRVQCDGVPNAPSVTFPLSNAYDGLVDMPGYYGGFREAAGYVAYSGFTTPSFDPTWLDFKVKYAVTQAADTPTTGDEYRITYYVGGVGPTVLQDWTNATNSVATAGSATVMGQTWFNQLDTSSGGAWTATDVGAVEVRLEVRINGDEDMIRFDIYEVWLTCYSSPLPPTASPTMAIIPQVIAPGIATDRFFVDIYVRNMPQGATTGLAGWQFDLNYDPAELTVLTPGGVYWPWTDEAAYDFTTTPSVVKISYTIPTSNPIYTIGAPGSDFPIARIYFQVVATSFNYSPLWFTVSFLGDPSAGKVAHSVWHGFYGNIPPNTYLTGTQVASDPITAPITTNWIEEYPNPGHTWHLTSWTDNTPPGWPTVDPPVPNGMLDPSDQVDMTPLVPTGEIQWFHVDQVWRTNADPNAYVYMLLTTKGVTPEFPLGIGLMMAIAPLVPIAYLWRTRRRVIKK